MDLIKKIKVTPWKFAAELLAQRSQLSVHMMHLCAQRDSEKKDCGQLTKNLTVDGQMYEMFKRR